MTAVARSGPRGVLSVAGLTLERRRQPVVRDLDWEARPGAVHWVVGENGSGKSTLLGAVAGRIRIAAGRIGYPSGPRCQPGPRVWYHPAMEPPGEVTIRDWRRLVASLRLPADAPPLAPDLPAGRRMGELSNGERKRIVLEALLSRPAALYLLDEPFEHLSRGARRCLSARLRVLAERAVVVVASHLGPGCDDGAGAFCSRVRLLGGGRWRMEGS